MSERPHPQLEKPEESLFVFIHQVHRGEQQRTECLRAFGGFLDKVQQVERLGPDKSGSVVDETLNGSPQGGPGVLSGG